MIDGSLVFVDISGFTSLTERLARKGKVGAEELNDILDATFVDLLTLAYARGADLVKWGGDAVLLVFEGRDHAARATAAAFEMRATMRRIGKLQTSAGRVVLRMSVGVHSGEFHFFLVGDRHRELVITGPGATRCARMETIAEAGEIAISPETARLLEPSAVGQPKEEALLLASCPDAETVPMSPPADLDGLDLASCLPLGIREAIVAGEADPEHRAVTAAFVEFRGVDDLLERDGPEIVADALDALVRVTQEAAARYGPSVFTSDISQDGGKLMLIAGAPTTTGVDDERTLLAARAIVEAPNPLSIRVGVNSGHVFSGAFGPPFARSYSVKGDAINLAARVMGRAAPGGVVATARVIERSRVRFETVALEPFLVKGKRHPVSAFEVGPATADRRTEDRRLPLVGREREMIALRAALDRVRAGSGGHVELLGEPGLGKSRLIEELRAEALDLVVLTSACEEYGSNTPYGPLRPILRDLLGLGEDVSPEVTVERLRQRLQLDAPELLPWLPLLAGPLDVDVPETPETEPLGDEFRRAMLEERFGSFLAALLPTPTLLVFEDTHWMDEASAALLQGLLPGLAARPWLLCTTRRDTAGGFAAREDPDVVSLLLEPIGAEDAAAIAIAETEDAPLPLDAMELLTRRAGGNPLFLRELLQAARDAGGVSALPDTVEAVIASQIDALPSAERTRLRRLAVLGARFGREVAGEVLEDQAIARGEIGPGLSRYLLEEEDGTLRFVHALVRDAAYEGLPFRHRRTIHSRAGEVIERRAPDPALEAEILSYHFFHSDQPEKAWRYSVVAGDRAKGLFANLEASEFYGRALELARRIALEDRDRIRVLTDLGEVRERLGRYDQASVSYTAARRLLAGDPVETAALIRREAWIREAAGRFADAVRWHRRGLRLLEGADSREARAARAAHLVGVASMRHAQGRVEESIEWCHRAIAEAESGDDPGVVAHASYLLDWLYDELGRPQDAPYPGRALAIYEELDDPVGQANVLNNLGMFAYFRGDWDEAVELYDRGRRARLRIGDAVNAAYGTANVAEIRLDQGHLEEAETRFREALRVWRSANYRQGVAFATANLGRLAARRGSHEEATERFGEARAEFRDVGFTGYVLDVETRMAENDVFAERPASAIERSDEVLEGIEAIGGMPALAAALRRIRGYAFAQRGEGDRAREELDQSLALGRERQARFEIALTLEAIARVERVEPPPDVLETFETLGVVWTPRVPLLEPVRPT